VISLHQHGVENVVASSGTSLTENQIKLIQRHTSNITVLFDGDAAGIRASVRGIDMILQQGLDVKAVVFPDGEDPDSYSESLGRANFQEFLKENAEDFIHLRPSYYRKVMEMILSTKPIQ
jgi:DNA primase